VDRPTVIWKRGSAYVRRLAASPEWPLTSGLALGLTGLLEAYVYTRGSDNADPAATMLLAVLATLPLVVRRRHLALAATVITLATLGLLSGGDVTPLTASGIASQVWVLYLVAERYRGWLALLLGILLAAMALSVEDPGLPNVVLLGLGVAALAVGNARRLRGQAIAERHAAERVRAEAQHEQAAMEERARIARELHDVVAHHVSTIAIQADTARLTTPDMPGEGGRRLEAIGQTARDALTEMRRVLGVLRTDSDDGAERAPQPGLERLAELLDTARAAGTPVRFVLEGHVAPLPPGVELAAYRIVQEALTNARRHAPGAAVDVELRYTPDGLHLRIRDTGPGPTTSEPDGHGLLGMRERAAMVGGSVRSGPAPGGGFAVEADLPVAGPAS
jgi:signal transduction histidine kinase